MKKDSLYILLSFIILVFLAAGCEDEETKDKDLLVGKWGIISSRSEVFIDGSLAEDSTMFFDTPLVIFEFKSDGRGSVTFGEETQDNFTWTRNGTSLSILFDDVTIHEGFLPFPVNWDIQALTDDLLAIHGITEEDFLGSHLLFKITMSFEKL